ncbi:MAG TPA: hypothetical protein VES21_14350 [Nocardioidaceae bacterium]|nr:hypothetical protein [Nocardioidaceae bacterium]
MIDSSRVTKTREDTRRHDLARERVRISDELTAIAAERDRLAEARELMPSEPGSSTDSRDRDTRALLMAARLRDEAAIIRDLAANRRDLEANRAAAPNGTAGSAMMRGRAFAREDRAASRYDRMASAIDRQSLSRRSVSAMVTQ